MEERGGKETTFNKPQSHRRGYNAVLRHGKAAAVVTASIMCSCVCSWPLPPPWAPDMWPTGELDYWSTQRLCWSDAATAQLCYSMIDHKWWYTVIVYIIVLTYIYIFYVIICILYIYHIYIYTKYTLITKDNAHHISNTLWSLQNTSNWIRFIPCLFHVHCTLYNVHYMFTWSQHVPRLF